MVKSALCGFAERIQHICFVVLTKSLESFNLLFFTGWRDETCSTILEMEMQKKNVENVRLLINMKMIVIDKLNDKI